MVERRMIVPACRIKLPPRRGERVAEGGAVFRGRIARERNAQRPVDHLVRRADRRQHVAAPAALARAALGNVNALCFEIIHQNLAPVAGQGERENVRAAAAEEYNAGNGFGERLYALRAQRLHAGVRFRHFRLCDAHRLAESGDLRHRLGAGAHAFLLPAAENVRRELQPLPDVQRADALGRMDLVSAHGYHVRAERFGG